MHKLLDALSWLLLEEGQVKIAAEVERQLFQQEVSLQYLPAFQSCRQFYLMLYYVDAVLFSRLCLWDHFISVCRGTYESEVFSCV